MRQLLSSLVLGIGALALGSHAAHAQDHPASYPTKLVKIIVPLPPGGMPDLTARLVAENLGKLWGQPVVVENRPGAGGNIAATAAARSAPDGYTLFLLPNFISEMNPHLYSKLDYDPIKDFQSISLLATSPFVLAVRQGIPVTSVKDLVQYVKSKPDGITYASSGSGSNQHLLAEQFRGVTGLKMVHVPYKGGAAAIVDILGGNVDMTFAGLNQVLPHVKTHRLTVLGVAARKRSSFLPNVPTMEEAGYPGFESEGWVALAAPAGLPAPLLAKINRDVREAMKREEVVQALREQANDVETGSPEELDRRIQAGSRAWGAIIKQAGIKAD